MALSILMIASEAVPYAKTGGLADVIGALPPALGRAGHQVTVAVPRYRGVEAGSIRGRWRVEIGGQPLETAFFEHRPAPGVRVVLVDQPDLYQRAALYGTADADYPDNARRFAFLARAALEWVAREGRRLDVMHAHDWQTGLTPVYLRTRYARHPVLGGLPSVFTIHNLAYQGLFSTEWSSALDLPPDVLGPDALEYWGQLSFLKAGIHFSDMVTTVSPTYAREILEPELGFGFDGILRARRAALVGVLNGIDTDLWNPRRDAFLPEPFSAGRLEGKRVAKRALLERVGLSGGPAALPRPLVGLVSRLVEQKGFDLLAELEAELPRLGATFVLLGTGEDRFERFWTGLAARHPDRVAIRIGFDEALAHLIEAGADMFLMPSKFEPCGLNQMYSLAYGTIPIVRATGGLNDTVRDHDARAGTGDGFTFREYSARALLATLRRALEVYGRPDEWRRLQQRGMRADHSWDVSAREYVKVYERVITPPGRPPSASGRHIG